MTFKELTLPADLFIVFTDTEDDEIYEATIIDIKVDEEKEKYTLIVDDLLDAPAKMGGLTAADYESDCFHGAGIHLFLNKESAEQWYENQK